MRGRILRAALAILIAGASMPSGSRAVLAVCVLLAGCGGSSPDPCKPATLAAGAGPAQSVAKHATVQLDGSAVGVRGNVSFVWRLDAVPPGSTASLSAADSARPSFVPDQAGVYVASVVAQDSCGPSAPAVTAVAVANGAPVASGGPDQQALPGDTVTLDGSGSSDPDQDAISFQWSLVSRPAGSNTALSSATAEKPTLVPDQFGTYVALLTVTDGAATSTPAAVVVRAGVTGPTGNCSPAAPPVALVGPDQSLSFSSSVQLDGTQSTTGRNGALKFKWTLTSVPSGSTARLDSDTTARPSFFVDRRGVYVVTLVVNDGCVDSAPATVKITRANNPPNVFLFSPSSPVPILAPVDFQFSTFDFDNDPLTFAWQIVSAPAGSTAGFADATARSPGFSPDLPGSYTVSLVVNDGLASSPPATTSFTAVNLPPVAVAGPDQTVGLGAKVTLDGSASHDPSHRAMTFAWTLQGPPGSTATLSDPASPRPTFTPDVTGTWRAQLTVTAGGLSSQAATSVAVWPAVERFAHRVTDAAYSTALDRLVTVATDPNALYIYDPRSKVEDVVSLSLVPASVNLTADGRFAIVAHDSAVSQVDLVAKTVVTTLPFLGDLALAVPGDNAFVYAFPRTPAGDHVRIQAQPLAGGTETTVTSALIGVPHARVRNGAGALYVTTDQGFGFGGIEKYALAAGKPVLVPLAPGAGSNTCGNIWLSEAGTRMFTRCESVLRVSSSPADDLTAGGTLGHPNGATVLIRHLSDSAAAGEISAVTGADSPFFNGPDDQALRRWRASDLSQIESVPFPSEVLGPNSFHWNGRFAFYRSDGSERYVVLQLDPAAAALQDFGVVVF